MSTQELYRVLTEVNIKAIRVGIANDDVLFEKARSAGMLSLLMEAEAGESQKFDNADAQKLQVQVKQALEAIDELAAATPKMPNLKGVLDALKNGLPNDNDIASLIKLAPKELPKKVAETSKKLSQVTMTKAAITNMLTQFGESLAGPIGELDPKDQKKTLEQLTAQSSQAGGKIKSGGKEIKFPTADSLAKALQKAYTVPGSFMQAIERGSAAAKEASGGFFAKGLAALKSAVFGETKPPNIKFDGIAADFMKMTAEQISGEFLQKVTEQGKKDEQVAQGTGEAAAQAQSGAEAGPASGGAAGGAASGGAAGGAASGGAASGGAASGGAASGGAAGTAGLKGPLTKAEWQKMANEKPEEFAGLVNKAAKQDILKTEAVNRWGTLAGIKNKSR